MSCGIQPATNRYYKNPLFWTVVNETWWDHPGHQKVTNINNGLGPGWKYEGTAVFMFC